MKYLYALMDDQTRFWIAQEVADTKFTADLRPLFKLGKAIADKQPKTLITDGAPNFHEAYLREFWTADKANRTEHIQEIRMSGKVHNNKMERFNGQIRDRERVMRTLEKPDTPILAEFKSTTTSFVRTKGCITRLPQKRQELKLKEKISGSH